MSKDNGIYILKQGNKYKVRELQSIENIYYDADGNCTHPKFCPSAVEEMFGSFDEGFTYRWDTALHIAGKMLRNIPVCEYGIQFLQEAVC